MNAATWKGCTCASSCEAVGLAPRGKAARGVEIGFARVVVVDLRGEEFEHARAAFGRRREQAGGKHGGGGGEDEGGVLIVLSVQFRRVVRRVPDHS